MHINIIQSDSLDNSWTIKLWVKLIFLSDLWDLWSSRIFSSISLFWLGANVSWLMKSKGRGWSGSWSPNSACKLFKTEIYFWEGAKAKYTAGQHDYRIHYLTNTRQQNRQDIFCCTCNVYDPSRAWVTNEQGSRPEATSSRSCRHKRYLKTIRWKKKKYSKLEMGLD